MATYLYYAFPNVIAADPGAVVDIETMLSGAFGSDYGGYAEYQLAYYGPNQLKAWDFSYWNLSSPSVARWFVNGSDIGGSGANLANQQTVMPSQLATADFHAGNDIGPLALITVPVAGSPGNWTQYIQYALITVAPSLISPTAGDGAPSVADLLATVQRFAATYVDVPNDNDCHHIAEAVAGATGATLPYLSYFTDPTQNQEGGYWRIVYRGSDPNPVAHWQTLVQPGDIVRMGWTKGDEHTTLVLNVHANYTLQVYDNVDLEGQTDTIGIHWANYDPYTIASSITIYRLTTDGLYLVNGSGADDALPGTVNDDLFSGNGGEDAMSGGVGNDVYIVDSASDRIVENPNQGNDIAYASIDFTIGANIEAVVLVAGAGNLDATGNDAVNALIGNSGNNTLDGKGGDDTMIGGAGDDSYFVDSTSDLVVERPGEGTDVVYASVDYTIGPDVESLVLVEGAGNINAAGNSQANVLVGNSGNNTLDGKGGDDTMIGGAGNDVYVVDSAGDEIVENPNEGNDVVHASIDFTIGQNVESVVLIEGAGDIDASGNNVDNALVGNFGANVLDGKGAHDLLIGNGGDDTFVFAAGEADGDAVGDFAGNGAGAGDGFRFEGFGTTADGASFTRIGATNQWLIHSGLDGHDEVITLLNGASVDTSDVLFV